jgi:hypothetical protein
MHAGSLFASAFQYGVARFFLVQHTKTGKIYHITTKNTKCPLKIPNGYKIDKVSIQYNNIFHYKTLQKLPKFGLLGRKYTIWQPCVNSECQILQAERFSDMLPPPRPALSAEG